MSISIGSTPNTRAALTLPRAILFDMDGTLTRPLLDFDQIRRDMGIGSGPILESLKKMAREEKMAAEKILHEHEDRGARDSTLNPGCRELLKWLADKRIATALVTRNTRQKREYGVFAAQLIFNVCITREDGKYKPDPAPLLLTCERLKVNVADAWMVGDGYHDIEAAVAAQMISVWVSHGSERNFVAKPTCVVRDLLQLSEVLSMK